MKRLKRLLAPLLFLLAPAVAEAATDSVSRPVTQVYALEIGEVRPYDSYLSPQRYAGPLLSLSGEWTKVLPWSHNRWNMAFNASLQAGSTLNQAVTARMLDFAASFSWGVERRFRLPYGIELSPGALVDANIGVLWLPRNSNNPAAARGAVSLGVSGRIARPFRIGKLHFLLSDRVAIPLVSAFFSPEYGESYYEIYLGNHSGLIHFGYPGRRFCLDNLLAADLDIGPSALRLGYRFTLSSQYVCHINTRIITNAFVVGWIPHGIGLRRNAPSHKTITLNALY